MDNQLLKNAFYQQLKLGRSALKKDAFQIAFYHFENAHVFGFRGETREVQTFRQSKKCQLEKN